MTPLAALPAARPVELVPAVQPSTPVPSVVPGAAVGVLTLRPARECDVAGIVRLVNGFAAQRVMLFRTPDSVRATLDDFVVAVDEHGHVMACGALKHYSPPLAEVASVAVDAAAHGHGLGRRIVAAVEQLARLRGVEELFALTLSPGFFGAIGYSVTDRARYPEKTRRDCLGCARRHACDEICVARRLVAHEELAAAA